MVKKRWAIAVTVLALVVDVAVIVLAFPVVFGPDRSGPDPSTYVMLGLLFFGLFLMAVALILQRPSKTPAEK